MFQRQKRLKPLRTILSRHNRRPPTDSELEQKRRDHDLLVARVSERMAKRGVRVEAR
jgi:hypothetical protein